MPTSAGIGPLYLTKKRIVTSFPALSKKFFDPIDAENGVTTKINFVSGSVEAACGLGHLAVMIYAVQGGLTAGEIMLRTQGSVGWAVFYGLFVLMAAIHGAIGLRTIVREWLGVQGIVLTGFAWATFFGLIAMGARAVHAVTFGL